MNNQKQPAWDLTWLLVKNRLLAQTGINVFRYEKDPKIKRNKLIMMVGIALIIVTLIGYVTSTAVGYAILGLNELTPGLALMLTSLLVLLFTMFKANGELFGFKDYDLVMSLPFSTRVVINSRFINMYLWNTLISLVVMLPMGAVYAWFSQPSWSFYPMWLLGTLLASLLPTTLAAILGAGITAIAVKFKYANGVATFLSLVLVVGIMVGSMSLSTLSPDLGGLLDSSGEFNLASLTTLIPLISQGIHRLYPPAVLFTAGVVKGHVLPYLLFVGLSLGWYLVFVYVLARRYQQINTAIMSHRSRADYQLTRLSQGSLLSALYKKTVLRILKSTVAATNLLMGCVMALLAAGAVLVVGPEKIAESLAVPGVLGIFKSAAPFVIAAIVSMTNTASISLALEGKNIWLIKSLPIPPKTLYDSYLLVNLSFTVPTALLCSLMVSLALKTNVLETLNLVVTPLVFTVAAAVIGIVIGNRLAYYDWQEETQLVKQSLMSFLGMLGGVVVIGLAGVIVNLGLLPLAPILVTLLMSLVVAVLTGVLYLKESVRPIKA